MSVFYDNYVRLCALNNLSESGAAKKIGLSNAAANGWKNGKMPSATTQIKLANLFGISPGELMGAPSIPPQGAKKAPTETSEREFVPSYEDWEKQAESWTDDQLMQAMRKLLDIQQRRRDDGR